MKFLITTFVALAASVLAQRDPDPNPNFNVMRRPDGNETVETGTTFTISWDVAADFEDVLVNLILVGGPSRDTQVERLNITRGIENSGEYEWDIPSGIGGLAYNGLIIESAENPRTDYQWSMAFFIVEDPSAVSSSTSSGTTVSSTTTTSSPISTPSAGSSQSVESSTDIETSTPTSGPTESNEPAASQSSEVPENGTSQTKAGVFAAFGMLALAMLL